MSNSTEYLDSNTLANPGHVAPRQHGSVLIRLIRDRHGVVEDILEGHNLQATVVTLAAAAIALMAFYGASMGLYANGTQALYSAVKLPLLFIGTLLICFPPLYLLTVLIGAELGVAKTFALALMSVTMGAMFLACLTPVSVLFTVSDVSREFLTLLHGASLGAASLVMAVYLTRVFSDVSEETPLYPAHVARVMMCWIVLIGFVGIQVAWLLLPFVGDANRETEFLRAERTGVSPYRNIIINLKQALDRNPWR